jgi:hypothetical protein
MIEDVKRHRLCNILLKDILLTFFRFQQRIIKEQRVHLLQEAGGSWFLISFLMIDGLLKINGYI